MYQRDATNMDSEQMPSDRVIGFNPNDSLMISNRNNQSQQLLEHQSPIVPLSKHAAARVSLPSATIQVDQKYLQAQPAYVFTFTSTTGKSSRVEARRIEDGQTFLSYFDQLGRCTGSERTSLDKESIVRRLRWNDRDGRPMLLDSGDSHDRQDASFIEASDMI